MKVIDAFWEKKNLNVSCNEVLIEDTDDTSVIEKVRKILLETEYVVVKVPTGRFDIHAQLQQLGFVFIEASINFVLSLKDAVLSPLEQRLNSSIFYQEMSETELDEMYTEIQNGIFTTDRIILDDKFTQKQSSTRYINWIKDEIKRNTWVYKIFYKNNTIGFFTFKEAGEGIYYPFLAGLYGKYSRSGLGFATLRKPIEETIKRNGSGISTYASTNNPAVIRTHLQQGFKIKNISYVFVKHNY